MSTHLVHRSRRRAVAAALLASAGLLAAGCSSSSNGSGSTNAAASGAANSPSAAAGASSGASSGASAGTTAQQTVAASGSAGPACTSQQYAGGVPTVDLKGATIGFSQSESTSNPFRATETKSIENEAKNQGVKLIERNANGDVNQQNQQIEELIAQGAKALIVAPENSDGLASALADAKSKKIPVLTIDRTVNGTACQDFIAFIGSNFYQQAVISADDLGAALNGKGKVAILEGTPGNNVTTDRTKGFKDELQKKFPGISIVADQTAKFDQTQGQQVMEQMLQAHPDITGLYAENDGMALGAIQAIRAAGKNPGQDVKIVSIDGIHQAVQDVADGIMAADVETNPRFGPLAFESLKNFYGSSGVTTPVIIKDHHFTKDNAKQALTDGSAY